MNEHIEIVVTTIEKFQEMQKYYRERVERNQKEVDKLQKQLNALWQLYHDLKGKG